MSGVGFWELVLVFLIGLIVLGPERLPRVASQLGSWLGQARRMTRVMRRQLEDELNLEKDLSIRPRPSRLPPPVPAANRKEPDDTHSPAHDADAAGTGVVAPNDTDANKGSDEIPDVHAGNTDNDSVDPPIDPEIDNILPDVDTTDDNDTEVKTGNASAPEKTT